MSSKFKNGGSRLEVTDFGFGYRARPTEASFVPSPLKVTEQIPVLESILESRQTTRSTEFQVPSKGAGEGIKRFTGF